MPLLAATLEQLVTPVTVVGVAQVVVVQLLAELAPAVAHVATGVTEELVLQVVVVQLLPEAAAAEVQEAAAT